MVDATSVKEYVTTIGYKQSSPALLQRLYKEDPTELERMLAFQASVEQLKADIRNSDYFAYVKNPVMDNIRRFVELCMSSVRVEDITLDPGDAKTALSTSTSTSTSAATSAATATATSTSTATTATVQPATKTVCFLTGSRTGVRRVQFLLRADLVPRGQPRTRDMCIHHEWLSIAQLLIFWSNVLSIVEIKVGEFARMRTSHGDAHAQWEEAKFIAQVLYCQNVLRLLFMV